MIFNPDFKKKDNQFTKKEEKKKIIFEMLD